MGKKHKTIYYFATFSLIMAHLLIPFESTIQATPLDDFLFHPFFSDIFQHPMFLHTDKESLWETIKDTDFIKQNVEKLTQQLNKKIQTIDPALFVTALHNLVLECNIPLPKVQDITSLLEVILIHEDLEPLDEYKNYLLFNFINTIADFLTTYPNGTNIDYTILTKQLAKTVTETVSNIKNPSSQKTKKSFFKKKYLWLLLLFLSLSIVIGFAIGIKIKSDDEEEEKIRQCEEDTKSIKQAVSAQISQTLAATTEELAKELQLTKDTLERLKRNIETSKDMTNRQVEELAKSIDTLNKDFELLVQDYKKEKDKLSTQQTAFNEKIAASKKQLAEVTQQYEKAMEKLNPQIADALGIKEDDREEDFSQASPCSMENLSKGIDVAEKGLATASSIYSLFERMFGKKEDKEPSLQERLEKIRKETPTFSIPQPSLHAKIGL